ncbi:MAG: hypothetical protein K9J17_15770 [Flavobacteriales bacterium]|nr:hypothetical protein [Flavobacteriales bacterium]
MNTPQLDKYNMLLKVDDFFDDNGTETAAHAQIGPKHSDLEDVIESIQDAAGEAIADHTGVTEDKSAVRQTLEQETFTALTAVASFARDTNNRKLLRRVNFTLSKLQGMRDSVLYFNAQMIRSKTDLNIASLTDYAYTPAQLAALTLTLSNFLDITTEPKDAIEERAVANEQVALLLLEADGILEDLDGYMDTFRFSNSSLYSEYIKARSIDNAGGGTGGGEGGAQGYSASGTLNPMQTGMVLSFVYNAGLNVHISNNGPAAQMEVTLLLDGAPIPTAPPFIVNMGTPATGQLGSLSPVGNQIQLRNLDMAVGLTYSVSLSDGNTAP